MDTRGLKHLSDEKLKSLRYKATGITTRITDRIVQEFFNEPMGTRVYIFDHYGTRQADYFLLRQVKRRLDYEHHVKCLTGTDEHGLYIVRTEPTYHELVEEEIKNREEENGKIL